MDSTLPIITLGLIMITREQMAHLIELAEGKFLDACLAKDNADGVVEGIFNDPLSHRCGKYGFYAYWEIPKESPQPTEQKGCSCDFGIKELRELIGSDVKRHDWQFAIDALNYKYRAC